MRGTGGVRVERGRPGGRQADSVPVDYAGADSSPDVSLVETYLEGFNIIPITPLIHSILTY